MRMSRPHWAAAVMAISALVMSVSLAEAQDRIQVGTLECSLSSSVGLIVGSQRNVNCNFKPNNGPPEMYTGTMTKIGLDIGVTSATAIIWTVFTGTNRYSGMLAGTYTGAQAEATVGAGLGANVLIGGSNRTVALQPLSVQGQLGLNVAAGIGQLELHPVQQ